MRTIEIIYNNLKEKFKDRFEYKINKDNIISIQIKKKEDIFNITDEIENYIYELQKINEYNKEYKLELDKIIYAKDKLIIYFDYIFSLFKNENDNILIKYDTDRERIRFRVYSEYYEYIEYSISDIKSGLYFKDLLKEYKENIIIKYIEKEKNIKKIEKTLKELLIK